MIGPPNADLSRHPDYWHGGATHELQRLRAEVRRLQRAVDWRDRRIGDLQLRLRGAPAPPPDLIARMRKALEGWRPIT